MFWTLATPTWSKINTAMNGIYKAFRPYSSESGAAKRGPVAVISTKQGDTEADEI
jgi:hypothetical protein